MIDPEQRKKTEGRLKGRNLKKEEVKEFVTDFVKILKQITVNGKPLANSVSPKRIALNPDLSIEEMRQVLEVNDQSKLDFVRQLYIRGGQNIINRLFPDENIVNLPTISFTENGHAIELSY